MSLTTKQTYNTATEALNGAGLNWTVGLEMLKTASGLNVPGFMASVRMDRNAILGVVGDKYNVIQNADALSFMDKVLGEHKAVYTGAGCFKGGRLVYVQAKLDGTIIIPGKASEDMEKFLTLTTSHDGSGSLCAFFSTVRIVCQNTLRLAVSMAKKQSRAGIAEMVCIKHTRNANLRVEEAQKVLGLSATYFNAFQEQAVQLVNTPFSDKQMSDMVAKLVPGAVDENGSVSSRAGNIQDELKSLFVYGRGHEGIRGTAWAAYNAVAEYVDHHRSTRTTDGQDASSARMESAWFGSGKAMKDSAMGLILSA